MNSFSHNSLADTYKTVVKDAYSFCAIIQRNSRFSLFIHGFANVAKFGGIPFLIQGNITIYVGRKKSRILLFSHQFLFNFSDQKRTEDASVPGSRHSQGT